jgi:hypothetical protein
MKERQAKADAEVYYKNLLETAKNQARLQADSDTQRLLADERSAIAPKVRRKSKPEHTKPSKNADWPHRPCYKL